MTDEYYMKKAVQLAKKGYGHTAPNPLVGAVIVKNDKIIGQGWHKAYGQEHAERNAIASCSQSADGAVLYVTLEPCCHYGKQPPCTDAVIKSGIRRVVIGSQDPNPLVNGRGSDILRSHGISVTEGVCMKECRRLNEPFFHFITTHTPYVVLKYAMTLDGKISFAPGEKCRITGFESRRYVHRLRGRYTAVMVGSGTVKSDNPKLTCRIPSGRNPVRIICDSSLSIPLTSYVVQSAGNENGRARTLIATCCTDTRRQKPYIESGCEILTVECDESGHVNLNSLMHILADMNIDSILLEGGSELNASALKSGIVCRIMCFIAPAVFCGKDAPTPAGGNTLFYSDYPFSFSVSEITRKGSDILLDCRAQKCLQV